MREQYFTTNFTCDLKEMESALKKLRGANPFYGGFIPTYRYPEVKKVIYNFKNPEKPATIVFWDDGTKTVVRCNEEEFTREGGIAQCYLKKILGSRGNIQKLIESADIQQ